MHHQLRRNSADAVLAFTALLVWLMCGALVQTEAMRLEIVKPGDRELVASEVELCVRACMQCTDASDARTLDRLISRICVRKLSATDSAVTKRRVCFFLKAACTVIC